MSDILDIRFLLRLARDTVSDPQGGAAEVLRLAPARPALHLCFALVVVGSLILGEIVALLVPLPEAGPLSGQSALALGLLQAVFLYMAAYAIAHVGRMFGGSGTFDGALALITWLQFIFLLVQLVQLVVLFLMPPIAGIVTILAIGLFFWLLVNFITELHGFISLGMVSVMTMVSLVVILFVVSLVLGILGLTFEAGNV